MARIKIQIPEELPVFSIERPIQVGDINYGGHMGNERPLLFFHEARIEYFKSLQQTEIDFFGKSLIMSDAAVAYKGQGFQGDLIKIEVYLGEIRHYDFDLIYRMENAKNSKLMALGKTGLVFFDYKEDSISKAPEQLSDRLRQSGNN